jgi:hypothetical protein
MRGHGARGLPTLAVPLRRRRFPPQLGAVVQRTIVDGELPALTVMHTVENSWVVLDGVNDPNLDGACIVDAMAHVVDDDPSLAVVATLAIGHRADRERAGGWWHAVPYEQG